VGQNINNSIKGRDEKQTLDYQGAVWGGRLFQRAMPKDGHLLDAPDSYKMQALSGHQHGDSME
jgi:hypothetical protein